MPISEGRTIAPSRWRRWLYLVHRWTGIVTCLFFAMWFISGLVMVYVPFPSLGKAEWLSGMAPIKWERVQSLPRPASRAAGDDIPLRAFSLEMRGDVPIWRAQSWTGETRIFSAVTGELVPRAGMDEAHRIAQGFDRGAVAGIERVVRDQWVVAGGFDRDRPLWKVRMAGPEGRILYISSSTGAVVLDTDRKERFWNWLGSVPHWLYPTVIRQDNAVWRQVVMWVSGPCIIGAATGMWIGVLRLRLGRQRFGAKRMTPYRGWMKWHHVSGLIGGTALLLWIFSGWLSVDPFRLFASGGIEPERRAAYISAVIPERLPQGIADAIAGARRVSFLRIGGLRFVRAEGPGRRATMFDLATLEPAILSDRFIRMQASMLIPGAHIRHAELLLEPDAYWYDRAGSPLLPVWRFRYDDPARSWVHIDPSDGTILSELDSRRRLYRWLFDLFHKWDLNGLTMNRPSRDVVIWILSLLGLVTSISGIRIAWVRLGRPSAAKRAAARQACA